MIGFGTTVTLTPQTVDNYGDRTAGTPVEIAGCAFWEVPGIETVGGQDTIVYTITLLLPTGTAISPTDRIAVDGVTYEVSSQPIGWRSPMTGWAACVQVSLRRVDG